MSFFEIKKIFRRLKELRNCILRSILVWSLLYSIQAYTSLYFPPILLENQFFCLSALSVFSACSEFEVMFINFCNFRIIIIYTEQCYFSHLSLPLIQSVRTGTRLDQYLVGFLIRSLTEEIRLFQSSTRYKNLIKALN